MSGWNTVRGDKNIHIKQNFWFFCGTTRQKPRASDWVGTGLATSLLQNGGDTGQIVGVHEVPLFLLLQKQLKPKMRVEFNPKFVRAVTSAGREQMHLPLSLGFYFCSLFEY